MHYNSHFKSYQKYIIPHIRNTVLEIRKQLFWPLSHTPCMKWNGWSKKLRVKFKSQLDVVPATTSIVPDFKLWFNSDSLQTRWVVFSCTLATRSLLKVARQQLWVAKIVIILKQKGFSKSLLLILNFDDLKSAGSIFEVLMFTVLLEFWEQTMI